MNRRSWKRHALSTFMLAGVAAGCGALGEGRTDMLARAACPELGGGAMSASFHADAKINGTIRAFVQASADLRALSTQIEGEVIQACKRMGADLGVALGEPAEDSAGAKVNAACGPVLSKIDAILKTGVSAKLDVSYTPPECRVEANAYASCAGGCNVNVDPGYIKAHCEPGHLSGMCQGKCTGSCEGSCQGDCQGNCSAKNAQGQCTGHCDGTCSGHCSATCHASCDVEFQAPRCDVQMKGPSVDAKCEASCKAHADFTAQCTPPHAEVNASVNVGEMGALVATLRTNLPILIRAEIGYGKRLVGDIQTLVEVGGDLVSVIGEAGAHATSCISAAAAEVAQAQVSVRVSVQVSASVSGRVSGRAGS